MELLTAIDDAIERIEAAVRRSVDAGDPNSIAMWNRTGGSERYQRRRRWWTDHHDQFAAPSADAHPRRCTRTPLRAPSGACLPTARPGTVGTSGAAPPTRPGSSRRPSVGAVTTTIRHPARIQRVLVARRGSTALPKTSTEEFP